MNPNNSFTGNSMTPNDILSYCLRTLKDVALVESWGEQGIFYNPDHALKREWKRLLASDVISVTGSFRLS